MTGTHAWTVPGPADRQTSAVDGDEDLPLAVVLRALKLGDLLVAVPALRAIRRALPHHRVALATAGWLAPLAPLIPEADVFVPQDGLDEPLAVSQGHVDIAINLHGNGPQSAALLDALSPRLRVGHQGHGWTGPAWRADLHERDRWVRLVDAFGMPGDPHDLLLERPESAAPGVAIVHVGAAFGSRRWPIERFAHVAKGLARAGERVLVTGGAAERERAAAVAAAAGDPRVINTAGRWDLGEFAGLIARARILVSVDTGAAHLASAFGTPSVVMFGPVGPERWGPPPGPHLALTRAEVRRGDPFADEPDPALLAVQADEVLTRALALRRS
ncbi:glycosyltransferase family 9 protein [Demequina sp. SO4-13]|uniref:glycosyltransferase family 9 protein n=1 Tax=Demequina sp. SO4-13 TaxID=3401027 RepID=UPI003AF9D510